MAGEQPWNPANATDEIRRLVSLDIRLTYTEHARARMLERDLIVSDVLHVLKNGVVYNAAEPSTKAGYYKYRIEARTPNSGNREVGVVVIPDPPGAHIKIVTVMWIDGN